MATAALLASGGMRAAGDIYSSQARAASAGYNAKIADENAQIATQKAEWEGAEGEQAAGLAGLQTRDTEGKITVAEAANGVDVNSGSAVNVRQSAAEAGMMNELNIRGNAARAAYGYEAQSVSDKAQAALDRAEQKSDKRAGYISAASSLMGSMSQASMYNSWLGSKGIGSTDSGEGGYVGEFPESIS